MPRITAWRYWQLAEGGVLRSVSHTRFRWPVGEPLRAVCVSGGHDPPVAGCGCGIYGAHDLATLRDRSMCLDPDPVVVGEVDLWGPVVSDGEDHRARFAYPRRLLVVEASARDSDAVSDLGAYGVEVGTIPAEEALNDVSAQLIAFQALSAGSA